MGRPAAARLLGRDRDPDLLTRRGVQHARGAPARDRQRHVLVAVLVEDHVAWPSVGERSRHDRVVALTAELELDAGSGDIPRPRRRRGRGLARCCQSCRRRGASPGSSRRPRRARGGPVERGLRGRPGPELRERDAVCEVGCSRAKRSRPWNVREIESSAYSGLASSCASSMPFRLAAGMSSPLSGPTYSRPSVSRSTRGRRGPPTPGSTIARWTPTGMKPIVFASTRAPCRMDVAGMPCVMSMISASGAMRFITP